VRDLVACHSCNRYIASDYRYCPYCGTERVKDYEFRQLLDEPFDRMERQIQEFSFRRLVRIEERLTVLESDLDTLLNVGSQGGS
jgi:hypothetical protein